MCNHRTVYLDRHVREVQITMIAYEYESMLNREMHQMAYFRVPLFVDPVEPREPSEQRPIDTSCHELGYWVNELLPGKKYTARPLNQLE